MSNTNLLLNQLTEESEGEIIKKFLEGAKISYIMQTFNISRKTANSLLKKHNLSPSTVRNKKIPLSVSEEKAIISKYLEGHKIKDIVGQFNCSTSKLYSLLNVYGVPLNNPSYGAPAKGYDKLNEY